MCQPAIRPCLVSVILLTSILASSGGCEQQKIPVDTTRMPKASEVLTIVTPHSEAIREAFAAGFWDWYMREADVPVRIEWIYKGTPQCVEYIRDVPQMRAAGAPTQAPDVMFGGGIADHEQRYVLSPEGQALWAVTQEHRAAAGATLYHYPILPATYTDYAGQLSVSRNPLESDFGLTANSDSVSWQRPLLNCLVGAICAGNNHIRLQILWGRLIADPAASETVSALVAAPVEVNEAETLGTKIRQGDRAAEAELVEVVTASFADRFENVTRLLDG